MVNTKKFSEFAAGSLTTTTKKMAGISNTAGGENIIMDFTVEWTTAGRPSPPYDGLLGYNTDLKQYEYYDGSSLSWVQLADNAVFVNAKFIVQQPNASLPAAQALSALSTGILKSTTTTGVLSISAPLTSIDGLTTSADLMLYTTASNVYATTSLTAFARTLLDDANAAAMRTTLGLGQAAVKNVTDNTKANVASVTGAFTINNVLLAADANGTVKDGGSPAGMGTVLEVDTGTGLTGGPITTTGTISFATIAANSIWVNNTGGAAVPAVNALAALTKADDTNVTLTLGGTPATALINAVSLTLGWTGQLALTRGGTNASLVASNGGIVYSTATAMAILSGTATAGQILQSGSSAAPTWSTATYPATAGTSGNILTSDGTNWTSVSAAGVGSPLTTKGDLYTFSTVNARLAVGSTNGQILQVNSGAATGLAWSTATFPVTATGTGTILRADGTNWLASTSTFADTYGASTILYSNGANTITGLATANSSVLVTTSAGVPVQSGTMTNGQLIVGSTGATPVVASLTAGTGIAITPGAGSISIASTGVGSLVWNDVSGTSQAAAVNNGYIISNAGLTTVTIPATAAVGSVFAIAGKGAGGWVLQMNTGQVCHLNSSATSSAGSLASTNQWNAVQIVCVTANTTFTVMNSSGSLTVA